MGTECSHAWRTAAANGGTATAMAANGCTADPIASVVVVTYNSQRHLPDLLHSLRAQTLREFELIVVDSASSDATRCVMASHLPPARMFPSPTNLGYRRGNQWGMQIARGKHLLILNDDVELHPRLLEELVQCAERSPNVAVVAPAILLHGSGQQLNAAGSHLIPAGFYAARGKNESYLDYRSPADIASASGCCFLVRRSFLDEVGGLDSIFESLPSGWHASVEDLDLCWQAWQRGYRVHYQPTAVLWHKYAQKPLDEARFASLVGGRLVFVAVNYPRSLLLRFFPLLVATECLIIGFVFVRGWGFAKAWLATWRWAWRERGRLRELRRARCGALRVSPRTLVTSMQPEFVLAPALRRSAFFRMAGRLWFWMNAVSMGRAPSIGEQATARWTQNAGRCLHSRLRRYHKWKRGLDVLASGILLVALAPVIVALALSVWWRMGSPVLFRQTRIGRDERPFTLVKFRTMADRRDASGKALPDAARLNAFGAWLRSWSLDELPQLWNVLRGDMSIVGPRPLLPEYLPRYSARHRARHAVPPGLTGLAQVHGRNATDWQTRLDLDVQYVGEAALALDFQICWRTLRMLLSREGITSPGSASMPEFLGLGNDA